MISIKLKKTFHRTARELKGFEEFRVNEFRLRDELRAKEQQLVELSRTHNALLKEGRERNDQRFGRLQDEISNRQAFEGLGSQVASVSGNIDHLQGTFALNNKINTLLEGRKDAGFPSRLSLIE